MDATSDAPSRASEALDAIDFLIQETAKEATRLAQFSSIFNEIGAGTGVGIRLKALKDARSAVVSWEIEAAKERANA